VDAAAPNVISAFGFRQSSNMGRFLVDDLRIGLSFAGVTQPYAPRLRIECAGTEAVRVRWPATASGYVLQWKADMFAPEWWDDTAVPATNGAEIVVTNYIWDGPVFYRLFKRPVPPPTP
jgi:hypothetical protein